LNDDSTVVYYIVHDGIVKPRQNWGTRDKKYQKHRS
jgi:hypothetical protein